MAKKRGATKSAKKTVKRRRGVIERIVQAVSPKRRNSKGGNITRRQGV